MKIGLYFGSFNPIHIGHLLIGKYMLNETDLQKIWFVVSPQNPFKKEHTLLNARHRLNLVRLAIEGETNFKASDVEFKLLQPSYTINTLYYLKEKYPQHEFAIIMGSDSFANVAQWKNGQIILDEFSIYVYQRKGFEIHTEQAPNIHVCKAPLLDISASLIRKMIQEKKSLHYFLHDNVVAEIHKQQYYQLP